MFRELVASGYHPREHMACDFDIVSDKSHSHLVRIAEAEVIAVSVEFLAQFPALNSSSSLNTVTITTTSGGDSLAAAIQRGTGGSSGSLASGGRLGVGIGGGGGAGAAAVGGGGG